MPQLQPDVRAHSETGGAPRSRRRARALGASVAGLAAAALVLAPAAGAYNVDDTLYSFKTMPTLTPEKVKLVTKKSTALPGLMTFLASKRNVPNWQTGPTILDENAKIRWYKPGDGADFITDARPQRFKGKPVVTWWEGVGHRGYGEGNGEIYDTNYHHVATVKAGNGFDADLHEFNITPQNTALLIAYKAIKGDLSSAGGPKVGLIHQNVVQEVDIDTGKVLMQWDGTKDIAFKESWNTVPKDPTIPFDYMHMNSVNLTKDGNVIVSARATHAYYKINRKTGKLMWKMGGKDSDFKIGKGAATAFQHDVHQISKSFYSVYDNNGDAPPPAGAKPKESRGVILKVDEKKKTVTLDKEFEHPKGILAVSQGNMQGIGKGHQFIGWGGDAQYMTEFDSKGRVVWDARLLSKSTDSYRAYKGKWVGTPTNKPLVDAQAAGGKVTVSMSWNGSTEVMKWKVLGGTTDSDMQTLGTVSWKDLETSAAFTTSATKFQVVALDAKGKELSTSETVDAHG